MKVRAIITGSTGMVGEGVLHECLLSPDVEQVLVINRKTCGVKHPKLKEIVLPNLFDLSPIQDQLINYNACYFCLGITSLRASEEDYTRITHTLTMYIAGILIKQNPDMTFCYVSGAGTDGTETKKNMWMRVKGKTENDLMRLPFKKAYMFRPGMMQPTKGLKNTLKLYKILGWTSPIFYLLFPNFVCTLKEVGIAMIYTVTKGYPKPVLEVKDIVALAKL